MPLRGSQKYAVLLCKFSDTAQTEPHDRPFFDDMFVTSGSGGLNDYWRAASMGAVNLDGTQVFGWKTLDVTRDAFIAAHPGREDKILAAAAAFPEVANAGFTAVIAIFNVDVGDAGAQGGVLAGPNDINLTFMAHETGHLMGLEHSFDTSDRRTISWAAEGEYYDRHDIMSAMNVMGDSGHRFSPRGPHLNAPNLMRMEWLPADRIWKRVNRNSSASYQIDLVSLESPEVPGFLAADLGSVVAEFRIPGGFDAGLTRPCVLVHRPAQPNSVILASDAARNVHEFLPGQTYRATRMLMGQIGGVVIEVISFDLAQRKARLNIQVMSVRPPMFEENPRHMLGPDNSLIALINGRIVRVPVPDPRILDLTDLGADLQSLARAGQFQEDLVRPGG